MVIVGLVEAVPVVVAQYDDLVVLMFAHCF